ncbi:MAG: hypothetical protein EXS58_04495 [Candidatus Latescibacteria bacterium]|nr:hypothetical protein [Candidatus Latescibacterota bacterium]
MKQSQVVGWVLLVASSGWSQGYRLERDRVVVDADHLQAWSFPQGSLRFSTAGVQPAFVQGQTNAALDAATFAHTDGTTGGIRNAGSNIEQAANITDGLEDTYWEPDPEAPLDKWWVEIDLGRAVWAKKVVLRFVGEGAGDPFLQFKLLTSNGQAAFPQSKALNYLIAGRNEGLNKTQRIFEFDLKPTAEADPGFSGDVIQFLQIVATASGRGQAEEISQAHWNSLPEGDRGDVLYFRLEPSGYARPVTWAEYETIEDPKQKGPIQHYRQERPRLAEVEVWTAGDNISLGALDRGGEIAGYGNLGAEVLTVDGDYTTSWSAQTSLPSYTDDPATLVVQDPERRLFFDLGAWYWVNRALLVFDNTGFRIATFPNYAITLSDGRRAPDGSLSYTQLVTRGTGGQELAPNIFLQDNLFPLTKARYLQIDYHITITTVWMNSVVCELQLYGHGFLPQATLTSGPIELGQNPRILSTITWDADTPPGTQLKLRTRTGNQLAQEIHYFNKSRTEVTQAQYRKLLSFQRGDSLVSVVPGADWSNWSQFYQSSGTPITSPSPRRFAMIQATLVSDDPDQAVQLHRLSLQLDAPLASQIAGEIGPDKISQQGTPQEFTLFLHPRFQAGDQGFDQVQVALPPGAQVSLEEVAIGEESQLAAGQGRVYQAGELGVGSGSDSLWVRLPGQVGPQGEVLVALRFSGVLYLASNAFEVQVGLGEGPGQVWQRVDAGEASALGSGRGLTVQTPFGGRLLGEVEVSPNPFTPNGDGINDEVGFAFGVFTLQGPKELVLEVYDLGGRRVRRVARGVSPAAGQQRVVWDGLDEGGRRVAPGLYVCRVGVEVDAQTAQTPMTAKLVSVVY